MKPNPTRVLIVDPHADVLITLEKVLEDAGFDTVTAWSAGEALQLLRSEHFNVVLLNEYLPDSSSENLLRKIKSTALEVACVVMQSSATQMSADDHFLTLGAVAVVCKYDRHAMEEQIRNTQSSGHAKNVSPPLNTAA